RNAYVGGCDGVATVAAAEYLGQEPAGTIPHALILIMGDTVEATKAFDEIIAPQVNRVSLVDTFGDEKFESLRVAEALGEHLFAVRLDTPGSRRGDMLKIMQEVRWELDLNGFEHVQLFLSGGLDEYSIHRYNPLADAYGVGTSVSAAPVIDFAMDIVDIEGTPVAKRGKQAARKSLWRCQECFTHTTTLRKSSDQAPDCPACGKTTELLLRPVENKTATVELSNDHDAVRDYVLDQLQHVSLDLAV
ncbi:MAG TPA: nicotinate phosphoribosyltransferase, partial [bacterium]|nr:nicotinate phosphoribosyltransferase [bacterium]